MLFKLHFKSLSIKKSDITKMYNKIYLKVCNLVYDMPLQFDKTFIIKDIVC